MAVVPLEIEHITVVTGRGADKISLLTKLPGPIITSDEPLSLNFSASAGEGVQYVKDVFGQEPEVVEIENVKSSFKRADD
jgi:hypothetical protein